MRSALVLVFILACAATARAQSSVEDEARTVFKEGVQAFEEGRTSDALVAFQRAYSLRPVFKLLYNIGQAQTELGLTLQAITTFERYLSEGGDEIDAKRRLHVEAELSRLRVLAGGASPESGPPAPDSAETDNTEESTEDVASDDRKFPKVAPWVFGGAALVTTSVGIAMGARALSLNSSLNSACTDGVCGPDYRENIDSMNGSAVAADVLLITGALLTAATISIVAVVRHRKKGESK